MVGEWSYCSVFTRYYNHQNRCIQHNSALQRLSHCGLSAQPSGHFCVTHSQSCSNDDEPAAGHACTLRAQQCARRGRSPHLVQRRHRTPGRDAHARTERLDITESQRSTVLHERTPAHQQLANTAPLFHWSATRCWLHTLKSHLQAESRRREFKTADACTHAPKRSTQTGDVEVDGAHEVGR